MASVFAVVRRFLARYWPFVVLLLTVVAGVILLTRRRLPNTPPLPSFREEWEGEKAVLAARKQARHAEIDEGRATAIELIRKSHAETIKALDDKQRAEATALEVDPEALAAYLIRAGRRA